MDKFFEQLSTIFEVSTFIAIFPFNQWLSPKSERNLFFYNVAIARQYWAQINFDMESFLEFC